MTDALRSPRDESRPNRLNTDGWQNLITGLGTNIDKRTGGVIVRRFDLDFRENEDLYFGDDLAATIAELPAKEMVREWIDITVDEPAADDEDRGADADESDIPTGKLVLKKLSEIDAQQKVFEAMVWARVFGGSLLFLGVDDGGGDNSEALLEPLNTSGIQSFTHLTVFDRWDVSIASRYSDPAHPRFGQPESYRINTLSFGSGIVPGTDRIHETRFIRFDGTLSNRRRMRENDGWADSIYVRLRDLIRDYNLSWGSVSNILQDFAQAIFKMKGLKDAILSDKDDLVHKRMAIIDLFRASSRAVPLDADDEDFERKQTPIAGLAEIMDRLSLRVATGARQPATLLFGQSPSGMQSTGASDIRFFYDQIAAQQVTFLKPKLVELIEIIFLSADGPTGGVIPERWALEFLSLFELTELEKATLRKTQSETDTNYLDTGVLTTDEVADSRFGGGTYSTNTVLDREARDSDPEPSEPGDPPPAAPGGDDGGASGSLSEGDVLRIAAVLAPLLAKEIAEPPDDDDDNLDASHPGVRRRRAGTRQETPAFCKLDSPSYDAARCRKWRAER